MKGDMSNVFRVCIFLFMCGFLFAVTLVNATHEMENANATADQKELSNVTMDEDDGHVIINDRLRIHDPWKEWQEEWDRKDRERQEREARRVCGRDSHLAIVDEKCNATVLFDLPANRTVSLAKHLRSHARLKRRVLTLERMMRVAMAYVKLGAALRSGQYSDRGGK
jgi:hypothetical protein